MILIDDMILALVIAIIVLIATIIINPIFCFFGFLLCGSRYDFSSKIGGGKRQLAGAINKIDDMVEKLKNLPFVSHTKENIIINPIQSIIDLYLRELNKPEADLRIDTSVELIRQQKYLQIARDIYIKEGKDPIAFKDASEYKLLMSVNALKYKSESENRNKNNNMHKLAIKQSYDDIKTSMKVRELTTKYPELVKTVSLYYGLLNIEYFPHNQKEFTETMDKIFMYAVISSIRTLKSDEEKELITLISKFESGNIIKKEMVLNFMSHPPQKVYNCSIYQIKHPYSPVYKKLHWGQRKLLLSEIDFFNRTAKDMGYENFKSQKISVVYPGAAHGHKLMIQMEMFPNVIYYLWDPARYNTVLYIADFIRRKIPITFKHTPQEMEIAKKYVDRVFINMELPNDIYLKYHYNATEGTISDNYEPEYGFFVQKSADYYLKYKKDTNDESPTLFVSDIRLFTNADAGNAISYNFIKGYAELFALHIANELIRDNDYDRDMQLQRDWFAMTNASYGLFKFKMKSKRFLEYDAQYEYLNGDIVLQAWAPIASTETRLFVSPRTLGGALKKTNPKNKIVKKVRFKEQSIHVNKTYYNINKYTDKLNFFNAVMRPAYMGNIKLSELGMDFKDSNKHTINDIWKDFLPPYLIGMDAVLESMILYEYLSFNKARDEIKHTDIMLMISDMTQTLINRSDYSDILGYLNNGNVTEIIKKRKSYHETFKRRLDYNSSKSDRNICEIRRDNYQHKSQH